MEHIEGETLADRLSPPPFLKKPWDSRNVTNIFIYDATADGERFVFATPVGEEADPAITEILNWAP